jgi:predicted chitinase
VSIVVPARHGDDCPTGGAMSTITVALLQVADNTNDADYYARIVGALNAYALAYELDTRFRLAHFLSQIGHESGFRNTSENGNYTPTRMRQVFGCKGGQANYDAATDNCTLGADGKPQQLRSRLWTQEADYARNPQKLLSYVYALRLGNGDEASGDGFRYRGRGLVQLTGKDNYRAFTRCHNRKNPGDPIDCVADPDLLVSNLNYAIESAFYFWDANDVNAVANGGDVEAVTRKVNGGVNGLDDRRARFERIKNALD